MPYALPRLPPSRLPRVKNVPPRPSAAARGYGAKWYALSKRYREEHPFCADPFGVHRADGKRALGQHVDHIIPRSAGGSDDESNLQTLWQACHSRKTALWDGGFGNKRRAERLDRVVRHDRTRCDMARAVQTPRTGYGLTGGGHFLPSGAYDHVAGLCTFLRGFCIGGG